MTTPLAQVVRSIRAIMLADEHVAGSLATYRAQPSIWWVHDDESVPGDAAWPYATIGLVTDSPDDATDVEGRDLTLDVGVYDLRGRGTEDMVELAESIRGLLHGTPLTIEGWKPWRVLVSSGPTPNPGPGTVGYVVSLRVSMMKGT